MGKCHELVGTDFIYLNQSLGQKDRNLISDWSNVAAGWSQSPFKSHDCYTMEEGRLVRDSAIISTRVSQAFSAVDQLACFDCLLQATNLAIFLVISCKIPGLDLYDYFSNKAMTSKLKATG